MSNNSFAWQGIPGRIYFQVNMATIWNKLRPHHVDPEVLYALKYKMPSTVTVAISEEPHGGYSARVLGLGGNVVTQGETGPELFEMVNDAILTALDIPEEYRIHLANFFPPDDVRKQLQIPAEYLVHEMELVAHI